MVPSLSPVSNWWKTIVTASLSSAVRSSTAVLVFLLVDSFLVLTIFLSSLGTSGSARGSLPEMLIARRRQSSHLPSASTVLTGNTVYRSLREPQDCLSCITRPLVDYKAGNIPRIRPPVWEEWGWWETVRTQQSPDTTSNLRLTSGEPPSALATSQSQSDWDHPWEQAGPPFK